MNYTHDLAMSFKVIIVGAGIAGLSLGYSLHLANIDYVILERKDEVVDGSGAATCILPFGMRILHQFGLLEESYKRSTELHGITQLGLEGEIIREDQVFDVIKDNHAYPSLGFVRPNLIEMLYDKLPEHESRVQTGAVITSIKMDADAVHVQLEDGSIETGSIIIGSDGIHSTVRRLLVEADPTALDGQATFSDHSSKIIYGRSRANPKLLHTKGTFFARHGQGWFVQFSCEEHECYWGFYEVQEDGKTYGRETFTEKDVEAIAEKYRDEVLLKDLNITFGDLWDDRTWAWMDWMDEGCSTKWYHQRAVFVGDSAVKLNPAQAQGGNAAIESAAALVNVLNELIQRVPVPSEAELTDAFKTYQSAREVKMSRLDIMNRDFIALEAWHGWQPRLKWNILSLMQRFRPTLFADLAMGPWTRRSSKLDYVAFDERKARIPWLDPRESPKPEGTFWTGLSMFLWALAGYRPY